MPTPRKYNTDAERYAAYRQRKKDARLKELQAKGLPPLPAIPTIPGTRRWSALNELASHLLMTERDEMESYRDDRSESWQEGDNGQEFDERFESLQAALERLADMDWPKRS